MRLVVEYILKNPEGDRPLGKDETVTLEQVCSLLLHPGSKYDL